MVFLELFGVNDTEIATDTDTFGTADIGTLELFILLFSQVGHGALELRDHGSRDQGPSGEDT